MCYTPYASSPIGSEQSLSPSDRAARQAPRKLELSGHATALASLRGQIQRGVGALAVQTSRLPDFWQSEPLKASRSIAWSAGGLRICKAGLLRGGTLNLQTVCELGCQGHDFGRGGTAGGVGGYPLPRSGGLLVGHAVAKLGVQHG